MARILADVAPEPDPTLAVGVLVTVMLLCTAVFAGAVVLVVYLIRKRRQRASDDQ